jgi:hypothetical protein
VQNYNLNLSKANKQMLQKEKIAAFVALGDFLRQFSIELSTPESTVAHNELYYNAFLDLIHLSQSHNGWFTPEQVYYCVRNWGNALTEDNLNCWISNYNFPSTSPKTVGLILAGNIPLVGFHDFLSVLISGHKVLVKTSSHDQHLIQFLAKYLISIAPEIENYIAFTDDKLENFDAVIATGSNNTARYFEYYFKNKPCIIRKNRNSVAVLDGTETLEELELLGEDIFRYFGLGCRNVSKLFVPQDYDFQLFFKAIYKYKDVIYYQKYSNNYDYNKAVFLMSNFKLLDNEFLTLKEDSSYASPISSVFYEHYSDIEVLKTQLQNDAEQLQCIVSKAEIKNSIPFGQTQQPKLWDYADNVDTLAFLISV